MFTFKSHELNGIEEINTTGLAMTKHEQAEWPPKSSPKQMPRGVGLSRDTWSRFDRSTTRAPVYLLSLATPDPGTSGRFNGKSQLPGSESRVNRSNRSNLSMDAGRCPRKQRQLRSCKASRGRKTANSMRLRKYNVVVNGLITRCKEAEEGICDGE
jgi:hypothetical protein